MMSQIDIPPTLLGLLDFRYFTKFLGRDILHSPPASDRAFVGNFQTLAMMKDDRILVLQPKRKVDLYRLEQGRTYVPLPADPAFAREAIAFYQVASYLFRTGLYRHEAQQAPVNPVADAATPARP